MGDKASKTGRPKSRRMQLLENKIAKLTKQIEMLETVGISEINKKDLTATSIAVILDNKKYYLLVFNINPNNGMGKLLETRYIGDSRVRAEFEVKKYLAHEYKIGVKQ